MSKLERKKVKIFASNSGDKGTTIYGSIKNSGTASFSKDIDEIQNSSYEVGLRDAIIEVANKGKAPVLTDTNAVLYTQSSQIKYLYQNGIADYLSTEEYYIGSRCKYNNIIYKCIKDATGKLPTNTEYWKKDETEMATYAEIYKRENVEKYINPAQLDLAVLLWNIDTTYATGKLCYKNGKIYKSKIDNNKGNDPELDTTETNWENIIKDCTGISLWSETKTYSLNDFCYYGTDIWRSLSNNNIDNEPTETSTFWDKYHKSGGDDPYYKEDFHYSFIMDNGNIASNDADEGVVYTDDNLNYSPFTPLCGNTWDKYGSWGQTYFLKNYFKPCVIAETDTEPKYFLHPMNYGIKADMSGESVLTGADGDVMVQIRKFYMKVEELTNNKIKVHFSNSKLDSDYEAITSCKKEDGTEIEKDFIYIGAYGMKQVSNIPYSRSGQGQSNNFNHHTLFTYMQNKQALVSGDEYWYGPLYFRYRIVLYLLGILFGKNRCLRVSIGTGRIASGNTSGISTGTMNSTGFCSGYTNQTSGVKLLGIENLWGNFNEYGSVISYNNSIGTTPYSEGVISMLQPLYMNPKVFDVSTTTNGSVCPFRFEEHPEWFHEGKPDWSTFPSTAWTSDSQHYCPKSLKFDGIKFCYPTAYNGSSDATRVKTYVACGTFGWYNGYFKNYKSTVFAAGGYWDCVACAGCFSLVSDVVSGAYSGDGARLCRY